MVLSVQVSCRHGKGVAKDVQVKEAWDDLRQQDRNLEADWQQARRADPDSLDSAWGTTTPTDRDLRALHDNSLPKDREDLSSPWKDLLARDQKASLPWNRSIRPVDIRLRLIYNPRPAEKNLGKSLEFARSGEFTRRSDPDAELLASLYMPMVPLSFNFGGNPYWPGGSPEVYFDFTHYPAPEKIHPVDTISTRTRWGTSSVIDLWRTLPWQQATPTDAVLTTIKYPDYTGPIVIVEPPKEPEIQEAYMIGNLVNVTEAVSNTPLLAQNIQLRYDHASFSWSLSMSVLGRASMNLIRPDRGGVKNVRIIINGHVWVFLVEKYRRDFKFPTEAYSITGSSRVQLLAPPYAKTASGVNSVDITARQVMDNLVQNTGFTVEWNTQEQGDVPDWTIPAGALSYTDMAPVQLIARLAGAVGAIVSPDLENDVLRIIPRYRYPVWEWEAQLMNKIVPEALITNLGGDWTPNEEWNSCYVSGTNFGVGVMVRRNGTAGDKPAPDVYDDLMTDATANQYRGKVEICKGGDQEIVTLQLPLFSPDNENAPGLILPGMLCDVRELEAPWFGLCLETQISCSGVGASVVTQTIKLERHTSEI